MNDFFKIIVSGISATILMTIFSYVISIIFKKQYREPVLLIEIIKKIIPSISPNKTTLIAWSIHFIIGITFVILYYILESLNIFSFNPIVAITLGIFSGIIAIINWNILFKVSQHHKKKDVGYYSQLFLAHIIFAYCAVFCLDF